jgi:hypothetical protein
MDKREVELTHGKALLTLLGIDAILEPGIEPAPDLVFTHLGKIIGLEHTRLFGDDGTSRNSFQAHEARIDEIVEKAQTEYIKRHLPPVEVKVFITQRVIPKARVQSLTEWIVNAVENSMPECPGTAELRNDWTTNFAEEVDLIRMIRFDGQTSSFFFAPRSAWIRTIDPQWLQRKIDEKAKRLPKYLTACSRVWLLLVEEQKGLASTLEFSDTFWSESVNRRGFERVFVLRGTSKMHEMKEPQ